MLRVVDRNPFGLYDHYVFYVSRMEWKGISRALVNKRRKQAVNEEYYLWEPAGQEAKQNKTDARGWHWRGNAMEAGSNKQETGNNGTGA